MPRSFIAVPLSEALRACIKWIQDELVLADGGASRRAIRWVEQSNLHFTLKFLGEVPEEDLGGVYDAVGRALTGKVGFRLSLRGLGAFPSLSDLRVLWIGVEEGRDRLKALATDVEGALVGLGFLPEARGFTPHLTIARLKAPVCAGGFRRAIEERREVDVGSMDVERVVVMKSVLTPGGPIYSPLKEYFLPLIIPRTPVQL